MLALILTAFAELVGEVIVNGPTANAPLNPARPAPDQVLRYHGHAVPDEIECSPNGLLSVWWETLAPLRSERCTGVPRTTLAARYQTCWKEPEIDSQGIENVYDTNDGDAARLADIAEDVMRVLNRLGCPGVNPVGWAEFDAMLAMTKDPVFLSATPSAGGSVAGVVWRLETGLTIRAASAS